MLEIESSFCLIYMLSFISVIISVSKVIKTGLFNISLLIDAKLLIKYISKRLHLKNNKMYKLFYLHFLVFELPITSLMKAISVE